MNPRAPITPVNFGEVDLKSIIDISGFNLNSILDIDPDFLADEHPDAAHNHAHGHDHGHDHGHGHDHDDHEHDGECGAHCNHAHHHHHHQHDDEIGAFVFRSNKPFDPARLEEFLGGVVQSMVPTCCATRASCT